MTVVPSVCRVPFVRGFCVMFCDMDQEKLREAPSLQRPRHSEMAGC